MRFNLTQRVCGDKIGYHRFNLGAQISLILLSHIFKKCFTRSDLLTLLSRGKIQCSAFVSNGRTLVITLLFKVKLVTFASCEHLLKKQHIKNLSRPEQEL